MAAQKAVGNGIIKLPPFTGYTFTDEMWRTHTVKKPRYYNHTEEGVLRLTRPAPCISMWSPKERGPRTIAARAEEDDLELWASSSSVAEYEQRKQAINEKKRLDREAFIDSLGAFHMFPLLPPELRLCIWKKAMEEPVIVTLTVSKWGYTRLQNGGCGRPGVKVEDYFATAILPPLVLVNHESHQIAAAHYKRAFCGVKQSGGVLAAYPTRLVCQRRVYELVGEDDKELVKDYITEQN